MNDWEEYQTSIKNREWIKDSVGQSDRSKFASLSFFERGLLQELRRVRGRTGMNIENDITHIALATHAKATDRPHIAHAIDTLIARKILIVTDQQVTPLEETRREKKREEKKEPICAEASSAPDPSPIKAVILLPLNRGEFAVSDEDFRTWKELYPAVDVMDQLRKMAGWCHANVKKRKTKEGVKRFINSWLSRAQDNPKAAQEFKGNGSGNHRTAAGGRAARNVEALVRSGLGAGVQRIHVPDGGAIQPGTASGSGRRTSSFPDGEVMAREPARPKPTSDA